MVGTGLSACCMNGVSAPCRTSSTLQGAPGTSEAGPPPSPFCSSRLILSSFCPRCQLAPLPFSASLGTQCHCPRPPWRSLGRSWNRLRAQAGRPGCSLEPSERTESSWFLVSGAGSLVRVVCRAGLRQPEALAPHSFPNLSRAAGAGQSASCQPGSSGNRTHDKATEVKVPPPLSRQQSSSDLE